MAFTLGTGTFTNGSTTVTAVSISSGKTSYFDTGTRVVVGANPVIAEVEAVKAPTVDTFTLTKPWPHATGTYGFLANMTSEGVNNAVERIRLASEKLVQAREVQSALIKLYTSTAEGLAETVNGDYFNVVEETDVDIYTTLYRNNSGVASLIASMPTAARIDEAEASASLSETNSANSATSAANSATAAGTSETNAANSATAAQTAQSATEQIFDQFGDQYLGSKASDPTVDNDGDPLNEGDIYWNLTDNVLKFYTGTAWVAPESIASTAASNALASEQAAATSETNAANSASAASISETNAGDSASAALTSETNASNSATTALNAETGALASYNSFIKQYYGAYATAPTQDPNGNARTEGDLYFNTSENTLYIYTGTLWQRATTVVEGVYAVNEYTNIAGQTTITLTYDPGLVQVLYNGVQLRSADFTATNGTSIVLNTAVESADDMITVIRWGAVTESTFIDVQPTANTGVQRTSTGAVKAAPANEADDALVQSQAQTSPTDDTADALMRVGAFGLGKQSLEAYDLNTLITPGTYAVNQTGSTNLPTGRTGYVVVQSYASTRAVQIYTVYDSTQMFIRRLKDTWTPWQEVFHQENILGTVSQSGGVPTGAIIERGSNANGEYVKYADGTLICWFDDLRQASTGTSANGESQLNDWTYPASFSAVPTVSGGTIRKIITFDANARPRSFIGIISTGNFVFTGRWERPRVWFSGASSTVDSTWSVSAIGRWY